MLAVSIIVVLPLAAALPTALVGQGATPDSKALVARGTMPEPKASIVKDVVTTCSRVNAKTDPWDCSIKFNWVDPNSQDEPASCTSSWQWDGVTTSHGPTNSFNTEYVTCKKEGQEFYQFQFTVMDSLMKFGLDLAHRYKVSYLPAPADYPLVFSHGDIALNKAIVETDTLKVHTSGSDEFSAIFYGMSA